MFRTQIVKKLGLYGVPFLLSLAAYAWISTATSNEQRSLSEARAAEYVYLHQTRNAGNAQDISDRSPLQCAAD